MVKRTAAKPGQDLTPSTRLGVEDVLSPPRTRSAGRKTVAGTRSTGRSESSSAGRTTRQRAKAAQGASPVLASPTRRTPRSRKPVTTVVSHPSVHFQLVKVPPASELIPKAKTMKKTNVTMRKVKRQLDFDDIIPSPPSKSKAGKRENKKETVLRELQDRLDGISRENLHVKQPSPTTRPRTRGRKSTSPAASPTKVTVSRLARQLKRELRETSPEISPMSLRNGKVKLAAH